MFIASGIGNRQVKPSPALITFNWKLYQEIPHWREVVICITVYALYIVTYRFILYRLPILYAWKKDENKAGA